MDLSKEQNYAFEARPQPPPIAYAMLLPHAQAVTTSVLPPPPMLIVTVPSGPLASLMYSMRR